MSNFPEEDVVIQNENAIPKEYLQLFPSANVESSSEAFVLLLHSCMLNVGFLPIDLAEWNINKSMPKGWRSKGAWKFQYYHKTCNEETCWMTCVPLYSYLAVHGVVENSPAVNVYIKLKLPTYVNEQSNLSDVETLFSNCKELVIKFKDEFCFSLLASLQESASCEPSFGLAATVEDVKLYVLKLLPVKSVLALSSVNKEFNQLANSNSLWEFLLRRDFGLVDSQSGTVISYKLQYKNEYMKRKQKVRRLGPLIDPMFHPPLFPRTPAYIDFNRDLDPAIQQAFPYLRDRLRPCWLFPPYDF